MCSTRAVRRRTRSLYPFPVACVTRATSSLARFPSPTMPWMSARSWVVSLEGGTVMRSKDATLRRAERSTSKRCPRYAARAGRLWSLRTLSSQPHPHHFVGRASNACATRDKEGRAVRGVVDEAIVVSKFQEVLDEKMQDRLRKANAVFVPNRSFTTYCDLDAIERSFHVPLFGSRNLLRTEEREEERSYYWILEKARLPAPEKIEDPKDIDGLVIVKLRHKVKKLERGFFTAASHKEYQAKSAALLKQGVISTKDLAKARIERYIIGPIFNFDFFYSPIEEQGEKLELLGIDWRFETSLDGHVRLPADQQLTLDEAQRIPEYVVVGHNSATLRESSLGEVFDIAERYVRATQDHLRPGII